MRLLVPLLASLLAGSLAAQQPAQPEPEKCVVEGQVVKAGSGEPLKKARTLMYQQGRYLKRYTAMSDSTGRFTLSDVEPGRYHLSVERNGYVPQDYGERRPGAGGTALTLLPGQHVDDILFRLLPAAVIAGRVYDEDGEQLPGAVVEALQHRYSEGKRELRSVQRTVTNDFGEYRLWGLPPGRYYLSSTYVPGMSWLFLGGGLTGRGSARDLEDQDYVPTFYPGTVDPGDATPLQVRAGEQLTGIDFTLLPTRTVRVRGQVVNTITGRPHQDTHIWLRPKGRTWEGAFTGPSSVVLGPQGRFEIMGVTPGSYLVIARWFEGERTYTGSAPVNVGNQDVDGVHIVIQRGIDVEGNVAVEGQPKAVLPVNRTQSDNFPDQENQESDTDLSRVRVFLRPQDDVQLDWRPGRIKEDGSFVLKDVGNGGYRISLRALPKDYFLKSARLGGNDVLREGLTLSGGALPGPLDLVLSPNGARIQGIVLDDDEQPLGGVSVVLVPKPSLREHYELHKTAVTDQYGRYEIRGIPPGEYKLFAWVDVERGAYQDPDFLRPFEDHGIEVEVEEGQALNQNLTAIPAEGTNW